jgi:hypothetical protein
MAITRGIAVDRAGKVYAADQRASMVYAFGAG